jgi:hypothetical protein
MFLLRGAGYFLAWGAVAWFLLRWSDEQELPERNVSERLRALSGGGLVLYFFTMTLATVDWVLSAAAPWLSAIYALIFTIGQGMIGLCLAIVVARALRRAGASEELLPSRNFHDYGKLLLMFVMIWGWFNYSQWLLIWSGNLPEEIGFYLDRSRGGWQYASAVLVVGHFAVPFALLLSRGLKQNPDKLAALATGLLGMRYLDLYWNIAPNYSPERFRYHWLDAAVPLAMGALWAALFFRNLGRRPLAALFDPQLRKMLEGPHE